MCKSIRVYRNEEEYLAVNGGGNLIGTSIFIQSNYERNVDNAIRTLLIKLDEQETRNLVIRERMKNEIASGAIRFMSQHELLVDAASGHEDNESTHAARRCLAKRAAISATKI